MRRFLSYGLLIAFAVGGSTVGYAPTAQAAKLQTPDERSADLDTAPSSPLDLDVPSGWVRFAEQHYGYTLNYPASWQRGAPQAYGLMLTPPPEQGSSLASVLVLNLPFPSKNKKPVNAEQAVNALVARYSDELKTQASSPEILREAPFRWDVGSGIVMGRQVVVHFKKDSVPYQQWSIFLPSPYAPVLHLWQYTAPLGQFEETLSQAQGTLDSLKPMQSTSTASTGRR